MSDAPPARISFVVQSMGAPADLAAASVESLREQTAGDWEACVVAGADEVVSARAAIERSGPDDRVAVRAPAGVSAPAAALADGVASTRAPFVAWLDAGDRLAATAVERVLAAADDDVDFVYTDEDELDEQGNRAEPRLKPGWSPERLLAYPYTGRLAVFRRTTLAAAGGIRPELALALDHDVALRVSERARGVAHVPEVLYHRRPPYPGTVPARAPAAELRAVAEHLERIGFAATVEHDPERPRLLRLRPARTARPPVSIVIPTRGTRRLVHGQQLNLVANCVDSIVRRSTYPDYEIVCVVDDDTDAAARDELVAAGGERLRMVPYREPFNFARKINVGVLHARSEHLVVLNDDTEVITPEWIESLLMFARDPAVGAVGAKLRFADGRLQHVGVVAVDGNPGHPYYGFPADFDGHLDNARTPTNCIAVTAACMLTRRDAFESVGGLSLEFPLNYNDVDYCLKLLHTGRRLVFDPWAELFHFETSSRVTGRVSDAELTALRARWGRILRRDPYYNPGFGGRPDFVLPLAAGAASALSAAAG
ncbi:MAG TPA: glycosyltransferase [Acidimicrobiia bacterium]|nr:glycosyltransferase [Acidimicrobiia bacterium]